MPKQNDKLPQEPAPAKALEDKAEVDPDLTEDRICFGLILEQRRIERRNKAKLEQQTPVANESTPSQPRKA
jgi:hypothetical protein